MKEGHYIQKSLKLEKQLAKYLNGFEPVLLPKYRQVKSKAIFANLKKPLSGHCS